MFKKVMSSPVTSITGILGFITLVSGQLIATFDNDPATLTNWNVVVEACIAIVLGLGARDNGTTSRQAGAE